MPARKRSHPSSAGPAAVAAASVIAPNATTLAKQRRAAAEAIARHARDSPADHHPQISKRDERREGAARHSPLPHQRGNDDAKELVVDAVKDDGDRSQKNQPSLVAAPRAFIKDAADVNRIV